MAGTDPLDPLLGQLRIPTSAAVRQVWPSEPAHFTPWLADNLSVLAEQLGVGALELVGTEVQIPGTGRALDILARFPTGELVAIENQFATADHDHLTRGLAYAVGLGAVALVLIAESHLGEFRALASYLNAVAERSDADQRIAVYLVAISVEQVEEYVIPRFAVIESPNPWLQSAAAGTPPPGLGSVEEFLSRVAVEQRPAMESVAAWWADQPGGTIRCNAQNSVSLDRPHPAKPKKPLSHMLLWTDGTCTIQRGYLIEAGVVSAELADAFDAFLRQTFPDLGWGGKQYFLNSTSTPDLEATKAFPTWLAQASGS